MTGSTEGVKPGRWAFRGDVLKSTGRNAVEGQAGWWKVLERIAPTLHILVLNSMVPRAWEVAA